MKKRFLMVNLIDLKSIGKANYQSNGFNLGPFSQLMSRRMNE